LIGVALCLNILFRQMVDNFLVFVVQTDTAFQDLDPLLLTTDGEYVVKNLVLISGALIVGSTFRRRKRRREERRGRVRTITQGDVLDSKSGYNY
jgi:hypothetical protein